MWDKVWSYWEQLGKKHGNLRNTLTELLKNWWEHRNPKASPTPKRRKWALMGAS
jgi:hypothetical protein